MNRKGNKITVGEWLKELEQESKARPDVVPEGRYTAQQLAEMSDPPVHPVTITRRLQRLAGKVNRQKYRILVEDRIFPVWHYWPK